MNDYKQVTEALEGGADPSLICATCPWDRYCVSPPSMTSAQVKAEIDKASEKDREESERRKAEGKDVVMPLGSLMTAVMLGGKDTSATICPVFALRLRSSDGEHIAKSIKDEMRAWDDERVTP